MREYETEAAVAGLRSRIDERSRPAPWPILWKTIAVTAAAGIIAVAVLKLGRRTDGGGTVETPRYAAVESTLAVASSVPAPATYTIKAAFYAIRNEQRVRLSEGSRIAPGDMLSFTLSVSRPRAERSISGRSQPRADASTTSDRWKRNHSRSVGSPDYVRQSTIVTTTFTEPASVPGTGFGSTGNTTARTLKVPSASVGIRSRRAPRHPFDLAVSAERRRLWLAAFRRLVH
jgi:hypothetical protein